VIGVMFWPRTLTCGWSRAEIDDVADHIDHLVRIAGIHAVAIGSDFDGIPSTVSGLERIDQIPALFQELRRRGYSKVAVEGIAWRNAARVLATVASPEVTGAWCITDDSVTSSDATSH
jgi:microsomal dipeptidase-like Zn-dependent dipeptidase